MQFPRTHAVFAVSDLPHSDEPLIEIKRGILEDSTNLQAELLLALAATIDAPIAVKRRINAATTRATHAIRIYYTGSKSMRNVIILEESSGFNQGVRASVLFHASIIPALAVCVKYIIAHNITVR
jgi:hypothetical protein